MLQNACSGKTQDRWGDNGLSWEKCAWCTSSDCRHNAVRDVSKSNNDKSAVALLKKGDWQERGINLLLVTDITIAQGNLIMSRGTPIMSWDEDLHQNVEFSDARQLDCVFQDMKPPKSILRKGTDMQRPIQRVKFTEAIARHTKIRHQNPSLGYYLLR